MTQLAEIPRSAYVGDGSSTTFATGFTFELAAEVVVTVGGVAKAIGVDFDLVGLPAAYLSTGADVVFRAGAIPAAAAAVVIERTTPKDQPEEFGNDHNFSPEQLENTVDRLVRMIQEALLVVGDGDQGPTGPPGAAVELQVSGGYIQWRRAGDVAWVNLVALAAITGPTGEAGADGTDGTDGVGVPAGGATGEVLAKSSGTDFATAWLALGALALLDDITASQVTDFTSAASSVAAAVLAAAIGSSVQAHDADLDAIAALATTTFGRSLLTGADAAAVRTLIGLGSAATQAVATAGQYRGNTADKVLDTDGVWDAAAYVALTPGTNVALDMSSGLNFTLAMGGNYTLDNPTNTKPGQTGVIEITQDGTGSRTLAFGTAYKFAGGVDGVLSTAAGAVDVLTYVVKSSTVIHCALAKAFA